MSNDKMTENIDVEKSKEADTSVNTESTAENKSANREKPHKGRKFNARSFKRGTMSVVLTVVSLGTRVALAYGLSAIPAVGVAGIWWSVPIGWGLADLAGYLYYRRNKNTLLRPSGKAASAD